MNSYRITTDLTEMDFALVHAVVSQSYWAKGISATLLQKAMQNSLCFAVIVDGDKQVGFARVISDYATFAYLADVFIVDAYQGRGLSKHLMDYIVNHPQLQGLRRSLLATRDAHGLYQQFGFKPLANPTFFMECWDPHIYTCEE